MTSKASTFKLLSRRQFLRRSGLAVTLGPALAAGRTDLGHLRFGARADLAVVNVNLSTLLAAGEELATVRSQLTLVDGREVRGP